MFPSLVQSSELKGNSCYTFQGHRKPFLQPTCHDLRAHQYSTPLLWEAHHDSGDIISSCSEIKQALTLNTISSSETTQVTT